MTHDDLMRALAAERYGQPVPAWKQPTETRTRPVAEQLDDLRDYSRALLEIVDGTG